jgi:hypothetical protein
VVDLCGHVLYDITRVRRNEDEDKSQRFVEKNVTLPNSPRSRLVSLPLLFHRKCRPVTFPSTACNIALIAVSSEFITNLSSGKTQSQADGAG